jgi:chromate transporter
VTDPLTLFLTFLRAATLSVGGLSSLPQLRTDLVRPGIVTEAQVLEALTIGRLSTGPNGLYSVSLGYFAAGWLGALIALVAITVPPLTIVPLASAVRQQLLSPWAAGIVRGIALSTSGLVVATGIQLIAPGRSLAAVPIWQLALVVIGLALTIQQKLHPGLLVIGGAVVGIVAALLTGRIL